MKTVMDCARDAMMHLKAECAEHGRVVIQPPRIVEPNVAQQLVADILEGLRVFNGPLHRLGISDEALIDRARNIANGIVGNYHVEPFAEGRS